MLHHFNTMTADKIHHSMRYTNVVKNPDLSFLYYICTYFIIMIQRIQSIYLGLVIILSGVLVFFVHLWKNADGIGVSLMDLLNSKNYFQIVLAVMYLAVAVLGFMSLLKFKNRMQQKRINGVNILVNLILFGLLIFNLLSLSGELKDSLKGIGIWLPLGSIVLLFLANRAIQKDENLVKSVDRIR